jgi:hypothetical protein
MALARDLCWWNRGAFWCSEEVFQRISWLPGGGGLTAPYTRSNRPLWTAGFRVVSAVVGVFVLRLLVEFVPRTSSTPVATWFWQTEGRSAERVILGVRPSEFILSEFQSRSRRIFIGSHSLPPLWSPNRSFSYHEERHRGTRRSRPQQVQRRGSISTASSLPSMRLGTCMYACWPDVGEPARWYKPGRDCRPCDDLLYFGGAHTSKLKVERP